MKLPRPLIAIPSFALLVAVLAGAAPAPTLKTTEIGRGPTLVLVHTLGSNRTSWLPTARKLVGRYHIVMVDLPGHGDSPLPDPFSIEAAAQALDSVLALQKAESTIVVGQKVGGLVALTALSLHPTHAKGLVLIDVALRSPMKIEDQQRDMFFRMLEENYDPIARSIFSGSGRDSAEGAKIFAVASMTQAATIKAYLRELIRSDGTAAVRKLQTPMLFLTTDKFLPRDKDWAVEGKTFGWENPGAFPLRRIAGAGHLIAADQPDTLAMVISDFATSAFAAKK